MKRTVLSIISVLIFSLGVSAQYSITINGTSFALRVDESTKTATIENAKKYKVDDTKYAYTSRKRKFKDESATVYIPKTYESSTGTYTITAIGVAAFADYQNIEKIVIPNTVTTIDDYAFFRSSVEEVIIPGSVASLGKRIFGRCEKLLYLKIPKGIALKTPEEELYSESKNIKVEHYVAEPTAEQTSFASQSQSSTTAQSSSVPLNGSNAKLSIASFSLDQFDLTAKNEQYKKLDGNGTPFAIIKVTSSAPNDDLRAYQFNFGYMNHQVVEHNGELWVYVQRNAKSVTISRPGFNTISKYDLGTTIEAGRTYNLKLLLTAKTLPTQWVVFSVRPTDAEATIKITGNAKTEEDMTADGEAAFSLPLGTYRYKITAEGYDETMGTFTLSDVTKTHEENVNLKSKFATITLIAANSDAIIYVDSEQKGRGKWTGRLNSGSYLVECRMPGHRASSQTITVQENKSATFTLQSPTPITGVLAISSLPLRANIIIDGKSYGQTPQNVAGLIIGNHSITIEKEGYSSKTQTFDIMEGQTTKLRVTLERQ